MKKIILALLLAAAIALSGCYEYIVPVSNQEVSESLISRMKNDIDTHSIEGFTAQSTFGDVLESISVSKITNAKLAYKTELLGYPAVAEYAFGDFERGKLILFNTAFSVCSDDGNENASKIEELVTKLDAEFDSHECTDFHDYDYYSWNPGNWCISMLVYKNGYEKPGVLAYITVGSQEILTGGLPETPDIFPYKFGTDIGTVYGNEAPSSLPDGFEKSCSIKYNDGATIINLLFEADETGLKLHEGTYEIPFNDTGFKESLDYVESLAGSLENAIGVPLSRGYGIPDMDGDLIWVPGITYEKGTGGQGLSKEDVLNSGEKYFWLDMNWPGINFDACYGKVAYISVDFPEEYFATE